MRSHLRLVGSMGLNIKNENFARYIDEQIAEYERMVEDLDTPLKCEKAGEYLAPKFRLYLEREQDLR